MDLKTNKTFIIAELSANHNHQIDVAYQTIKAAKDAGLMLSNCKPTQQIQLQLIAITNISKLKVELCGTDKRFTNYTNKPILHGNGIRN